MAKILIIEDDEILSEMYATRLTTEGHIVLTERDGQVGFSRAQQEKPDVILLDLMLPGMTGHQVLSSIKLSDPLRTVPVIVLSNLADPEEEKEALAEGAIKYLVKTRVTPSQVLETITSVLPGVQQT